MKASSSRLTIISATALMMFFASYGHAGTNGNKVKDNKLEFRDVIPGNEYLSFCKLENEKVDDVDRAKCISMLKTGLFQFRAANTCVSSSEDAVLKRVCLMAVVNNKYDDSRVSDCRDRLPAHSGEPKFMCFQRSPAVSLKNNPETGNFVCTPNSDETACTTADGRVFVAAKSRGVMQEIVTKLKHKGSGGATNLSGPESDSSNSNHAK